MPNVSILGSYGDLSASQIAQAASALVPSGVVLSFAGATAPGGWLLCDGSLINRTTYATLFAAIGTAHGSGDGSTTFALPNYAGRFLRGRANGSANDPDRASRTAAASGGLTGDNVGSVQTNATRKNSLAVSGSFAPAIHNHFGSYGRGGDAVGRFLSFGGFAATSTNSHWVNTEDEAGKRVLGPWNSGALTVDASITSDTRQGASSPAISDGDNETRPLNAYVNYIIKI